MYQMLKQERSKYLGLPACFSVYESFFLITFHVLSALFCRKQILHFLDAERDISVLKGTLKPGDIIHYIFDRDSTMNISKNLYELLPRTSPLKNKNFKTCAIVGNSGILLNSGCGKEIDSHDFVIR